MSLRFEHSAPLTLGAELEFQLLNRETLDLSSSSIQVLERLSGNNAIKAEIYQSMIEIMTGVCENAHQVGQELRTTLSKLYNVCDSLNLRIASAGTHPFATYEDGIVFPEARYRKLLEKHQWMAKRLLIFGLHVHVGMRSGDHAIQVANGLLLYLPLFLALSSSSPFCNREDTQLASSRTTFFEALPTGGQPCTFEDWSDFRSTYARLLQSGSIGCPKDLWWDIRPSPGFGTIEIRICDSPATICEAEAIVALVHLLCQKIDQEISLGQSHRPPLLWLLRENKWRAMRKGSRAEIIVAENGSTRTIKEFLERILEDLAPLIEANKYNSQMDLLKNVVAKGSSADRQRQLYQLNSNFCFVLSSLIDELQTDIPNWAYNMKHKNKLNIKKGGSECA
ncbi:MAG: YbdK family carboxylate-amine ligase [Bdellovibrionales bacterium]|nr:YbdK family carboxylate-amine ligase [Bdellovibrionales bacterium]